MPALPETASVPRGLDVLICAHNDAAYLRVLLSSLAAQVEPHERFHVIVVDNGSSDDTKDVVSSESRLPVSYVFEPRLSLNAARNAGYTAARHAYVAHIDADCEVDPHWVARLLDRIAQDAPDLVGGPYAPPPRQSLPAWFDPAFRSMSHGSEPRWLGPGEFLSGGNMTWRRTLVHRLGGFPEDAGLVGRGLRRGDEVVMQIAAWTHEPTLRVRYDPALGIWHAVRPHEMGLRYWVRRSFVTGWTYLDFGFSAGGVTDAVRAVPVVALLTARVLLGIPFRSRRQFPFWQSYVMSRVLPDVIRLGRVARSAYELVRPSGRGPQGDRTVTGGA